MRSAAAGTCAALAAVMLTTSAGAQVAFDDVTAAAVWTPRSATTSRQAASGWPITTAMAGRTCS